MEGLVLHRPCRAWQPGNHKLLYSRELGNRTLLFSSSGSRLALVSVVGLRADPSVSLGHCVFMSGRKRLEAVFVVEGPFISSSKQVMHHQYKS